jgi:ABC-type multidrug transport system permease subunit
MPLSDVGLYSRGGALFGALIFNAFISVSELAGVFQGRLTLQKHKAYALYHPSAFHLAQVLTDMPFVAFQCLIFSVITYWMYGLSM